GPFPAAHPYESVYRTPDNRLMGEVTTHVRRAYAEAGLAIADGYHEMPDHVSVELEFMAWLANEEAVASEDSDVDVISFFVERQAAFLQAHLSRWIPEFCHRVVIANKSKFYSRAAAVLAAFVVLDLEKTQVRWQALRDKDEIRTPITVDRPVGVWWVGFREERPSFCTLCGICTEVCRPAALSLDKSQWDVELKFDAARCDGCGYCVDYCPERILKVESATRRRNTDAEPRQLAHSAIHPCRKCGKPVVPEALLAKVVQRFRRRQGSPADEASMYLCAACKPGTALEQRSSIGLP
ncbi:MAG: molecular chaperone TorD family protein, partial [Anaerolineales bacterium]